jgi:hypothetical protein
MEGQSLPENSLGSPDLHASKWALKNAFYAIACRLHGHPGGSGVKGNVISHRKGKNEKIYGLNRIKIRLADSVFINAEESLRCVVHSIPNLTSAS